LKQIAGLGCFRLITGRPRAAGSNAASSLGVPRPAVASPKTWVFRARAAGGAPSTCCAAGAHQFEVIAKWDMSEAENIMVQDTRGDANCARAQEGGGRAEPLVLLSVLSSWDTRVQSAR